jgi:hypothetical protein
MIAALAVVLALPVALAQEPAPAPQGDALRLFLDCPTYVCDLDFMRTEITFVNYVRDRRDALVYVLVSTQETGAGGTEYTLTFIGQGTLAGRTDTLRYSSRAAEPGDATRRGFARVLKLGLMRYVAGTPIADHLDVTFTAPAASAAPRQQHDPWNYWVFNIGARGFFNGESQQGQRSINGNVSANRTTEQFKVRLSLSANNNHSRYELDSVTTYISDSHSYYASGSLVWSLGPHWSVGADASTSASTYNNYDLNAGLSPGIEFNVFPYAESTRRQLTFKYSAGLQFANYTDTTIFGKTRETLGRHQLEVSLDFKQPWGEAGISLSGSQYFHDLSKVNAGIFGSVSVNIIRGLRFNVGGSYNIVRDQLALPAGGATPQEILVRRRQLATSYNYFMSVGLSYTFGSIYNNVVNPRFSGGSRNFFF